MQFSRTFLLKFSKFIYFWASGYMKWIVSIQTFKFEYFRATGSWVRAGLVSTKGLSEAWISSAWLPGPCQDQCGDPGHPLSQRQGVLHHNEHVLQVQLGFCSDCFQALLISFWLQRPVARESDCDKEGYWAWVLVSDVIRVPGFNLDPEHFHLQP